MPKAIAIMNASQLPCDRRGHSFRRRCGCYGRAEWNDRSELTRLLLLPHRVQRMFSGSLASGATCVAGIGSPEEAMCRRLQLNVITASDIAPLIGPRPAESNKGSYGHVLVVGGSLGKAGSVAMAGMSALRTGAGLVNCGDAEVGIRNCFRISSRVDDRARCPKRMPARFQ